jgi:hypothetical protein
MIALGNLEFLGVLFIDTSRQAFSIFDLKGGTQYIDLS